MAKDDHLFNITNDPNQLRLDLITDVIQTKSVISFIMHKQFYLNPG